MISHKIKSYIGFAIKAHGAMFGLDNILTSKHPVKLIVLDESLGEASRRKLKNHLEHNDIAVIELHDVSLGKDILSRDNVKIMGITHEELASAIIREYNNLDK